MLIFLFTDAPSVISSTSNSSVLSVAGSVSSSGYQSPSVITLDSPSPPTSPMQSCLQNTNRPACMMEISPSLNNYVPPQTNVTTSVPNMYNNIGKSLPYLEVDDSNGANSYFPQF